MDQSDESSNARQRSPYLPPPPDSPEGAAEVRVPRASPLPTSFSGEKGAPAKARVTRDGSHDAARPLQRAAIALGVFVLLALAAYWAFASGP